MQENGENFNDETLVGGEGLGRFEHSHGMSSSSSNAGQLCLNLTWGTVSDT